ncbi:MAG: TIGR00266 family protein [Flavobacteriales bacterium]|nr:TIGR00266 family protein [Flavobacteriales bacterium]|tara:strand:- start:2650 stop:3342 length:693 start_codon:yes stop_codon:yes gene_type:complete
MENKEIQSKSFDFEYAGKPDYGFITVKIPSNQTLKVEASAMATMDTNIVMKTKLKGGFSRIFQGESLFINEFKAQNSSGELGIAPASPGDVEHVYLNNEAIYLQSSAFVASGTNVEAKTKFQGLVKGFFSGESLFLIKCVGEGDLWFNSYGGIIPIDVEDDYVVDTGHIVAFTDGLDYSIKSVGGYKSLFFSGEGLVCKFSGKGKVWIQTRKVKSFAWWVHPFRRKKSKD